MGAVPYRLLSRRTKPGERAFRRMPRYFFDLRYDEQPWSEDDQGDELDSPEAAHVEAVALAAELAKDRLRKHRQIAVRVRNDESEPLLFLTVSLTSKERPPSAS
jgi:hypothetical protein